MNRNRYICQLDEGTQALVRTAIAEALTRHGLPLELDEPMSGRLVDLEDDIDLDAMGL